ncbi:MAG TPA: MOSC domain-containing protein [Chthoniobacterales bacterium]
MLIREIFISSGHNYFGHHGRAPDNHPMVEVARIECIAGHGIRGDRFYDYRDDYKGQITFFSLEVFETMIAHFRLTDKSAGAVRRNVVVSGVDLNDLIGQEFSIQGVRFRGTAHCRPCYWMDQAVAPGAEKFLGGNGGLRAQILCDGVITVGDAQLVLSEPRLNLRELPLPIGGTGAVPSH